MITRKQAYKAMFHFLENQYFQHGIDDLGGILGGMALLSETITADPARGIEWLRVTQGMLGAAQQMTNRQAYEAMCVFLSGISSRGGMRQLEILLDKINARGGAVDPSIWQEWEGAIDKAVNGNESILLALKP